MLKYASKFASHLLHHRAIYPFATTANEGIINRRGNP